ncbi:hypothetical protein KJ359_002949 [Pestalotiopsis sp. 9143b]|nr:hypothetical protein KJ359_002949 [Pestalotiopsis sp. 9143b]
MTIAIAIPILLFCPNFPQQAQNWFLKPDERDRVLRQLEASRGAEIKGSAADNVALWKVLVDWRIHLFTMCFFCCDITAASISAFSPTILTELGWTNTVAQLMTMPLIGWIIMRVYVRQAGVRYLALFFMSMGTFPQMPIFMAWLSANLRGHKYLAVGMAWMVGFGNCANFISSNVFIKAEAPRYVTGFTNGLVFTIVGMLLTLLGCALLVVKNKKREAARARMTGAEREVYDDVYFKFVL